MKEKYSSLRVKEGTRKRIKAIASCQGMEINKYLDKISRNTEIIITEKKKDEKKKFVFKL